MRLQQPRLLTQMAFIFPPVKFRFRISLALLQSLIYQLWLSPGNGRELWSAQRGKLAWAKEICLNVARLIAVAEVAEVFWDSAGVCSQSLCAAGFPLKVWNIRRLSAQLADYQT